MGNPSGKGQQDGVERIYGLHFASKRPGSKRPPMLSTKEVVALLGIHPSTFSHWITEGKFPKPKMSSD